MVEAQIYYPRYVYFGGNVADITGANYHPGYIYVIERSYRYMH